MTDTITKPCPECGFMMSSQFDSNVGYVWYCPNSGCGHEEEMTEDEAHLANGDIGTDPMNVCVALTA